MESSPGWLGLVISLPTENATERMRVWRTLKATGAGVLRDGVYVLPDRPQLAEVLGRLAGEIRETGGSAHVLHVDPRGEDQAEALRALFDRTKDYAALADEIARARAAFSRQAPAPGRPQGRAPRRPLRA